MAHKRLKRIVSIVILFLFSFSTPHSLHAAASDKAVQALQKNDFKTAREELVPLAEKGDRDAQFLMGMMYDAGKGVPQDPSAAVSWYKKAALQNHPIAQLYLGILYSSGQGVNKDDFQYPLSNLYCCICFWDCLSMWPLSRRL